MKKLKDFGPLFVIIAALLWSLDGLLRVSLYALPPAVVVFYEHLLGIIVLLFLAPKWVKDIGKMTKKEWIAIALVALFASVLGTLFYTAALGQINYIQFSVVVLLQQLQPIWTISTAALLLREKLTKNFLLWAVVALVSTYFITFKDLSVNLQTGGGTAIAGGLALLAGMMWGSSTAISKYVLNKTSSLTVTGLRFLLAPIMAFALIVGLHQTAALTTLNTNQWLALLTITFSTGMVALAIYYYGLKKIPARTSTIYELIWPASAIFIGYFYFHQGLTLTQILGVVVLLFSMYKVTAFKK